MYATLLSLFGSRRKTLDEYSAAQLAEVSGFLNKVQELDKTATENYHNALTQLDKFFKNREVSVGTKLPFSLPPIETAHLISWGADSFRYISVEETLNEKYGIILNKDRQTIIEVQPKGLQKILTRLQRDFGGVAAMKVGSKFPLALNEEQRQYLTRQHGLKIDKNGMILDSLTSPRSFGMGSVVPPTNPAQERALHMRDYGGGIDR